MSLLTIRQKFNPTKIGGCKLWLSADSLVLDGVADGGAVTTWRDLSGNGANATQATADNKPTLQTNELAGRPAVRFDGTNDNLIGASHLGLTGSDVPFTLFVVAKRGATGADHTMFSIARSVGTNPVVALQALSSGSTLRSYRRDDANAAAPVTGGAVGTTNPHVFSLAFPGTTVAAWKDGTTDISSTAQNVGTLTLDEYAVGSFRGTASPASYYNGDIAEVVIYSGALIDSERKRVERYLGRKYGVAIA